jgi:hypothetical protein
MSLTVEMLYSIRVEYTKGQTRIGVYLLRVLNHVRLFLNSLKLSKKKDGSIFNDVLLAVFASFFCLLFDGMRKDGVVNGQSIDII